MLLPIHEASHHSKNGNSEKVERSKGTPSKFHSGFATTHPAAQLMNADCG
jgi:hypothetical protein